MNNKIWWRRFWIILIIALVVLICLGCCLYEYCSKPKPIETALLECQTEWDVRCISQGGTQTVQTMETYESPGLIDYKAPYHVTEDVDEEREPECPYTP